MDINTGAQQDIGYPGERFNEKGCLQVWGGDVLCFICLFWNSMPQLQQLLMSSSAKHIERELQVGGC
jgi:hypothetical protein